MKRRYSNLLVAIALSSACSGPDIETQRSESAVMVAAAADTYVRSGRYASRSFGTASVVNADKSDSSTFVQGYMRFAVGDVGAIASATLRLYVKDGSSSSALLIATSDATWSEDMTWDTRIEPDGDTIAVIGRSEAGSWIEIDVTAQVASGQLAFAVVPQSTNGFAVASREAGSTAPELVIEPAASEGSGSGSGSGSDSGSDADPPPPPPGSIACLDRPSTTVLSGTYTQAVSVSSPPDGHAVDARTAISLTSGARALEIGSSQAANNSCVVGWTTIGQQSRTLSWRTMHDVVGGSALRVYGSSYVVDGLRAENVEDGFDPRGGEGFELRNAWMSYVRDDCIENDERRAGQVIDSLFDGCYTFVSEQELGDVAGESLVFDHVLARLRPMPAPRGTEDPTILGHGSFFKKFDDGGRHEPVIRDSIFFLEDDCYSGCKDWPSGTQASNVTIVWVGSGSFPMSVLPGMTLTTDRTVWDSAVARWKERHGCTAIDQACTKLHTPDPY